MKSLKGQLFIGEEELLWINIESINKRVRESLMLSYVSLLIETL